MLTQNIETVGIFGLLQCNAINYCLGFRLSNHQYIFDVSTDLVSHLTVA